MKKYVITIILLFTVILLSIGGYFIYVNAKSNKASDEEILKEKCVSEIKYLSTNIIDMMNKLNNISYSNFVIQNEKVEIKNENKENSLENKEMINSSSMVDDNILINRNKDINWDTLKGEIENIYATWPNIMMDLNTLNVNKDNLLKFNNLLDISTKNFENKDKKSSLLYLSDLYNLIRLYIIDLNIGDEIVSVYNIKTYVLYSYALIGEDWNKSLEYIRKAKEEFSNIINGKIKNINDIDIINKGYILTNELEKNVKNQDKNIFYINYSNLMKELENID